MIAWNDGARIGIDDVERLLHETEEVAAHPRHARELRAVRHLVDRDPQPEVARPEREALLQREDVRPDVVHGVARVACRERAGRTGRARAATGSRSARPSRWPRRAGRSVRAGCARAASPSRSMSGSSIRRIDAMLASTQPRRSSTPTATWSGVCSPVKSATTASARAGQRREVVVQRRAEVRVGEGVAAGDEAGDPPRRSPSRPDREPSGARRAMSRDLTRRGRPFTSSLPTLFQYCRSRLSIISPKTSTSSGAAQKNQR